MKSFKFKQFEIQQSKNVFRVGTDGVLLGSLANIDNASKVLEVGTGAGLISLMLAQRNSYAEFLGIDINEEAVSLTRSNFENSPFQLRLKNRHQDFKNFESDEKFDLIVSNPPYFEESDSEKDKLARQTVGLNFLQLISKSSKLLSENGIFSVIIPSEVGNDFTKIANENQLFLIRQVNIKGIENSKVKRLILEFSLTKKEVEESECIIEKSPRQYSDQYIELTKEFHVFKEVRN
ncbi:tRNA1(Val) (adenine(37)-N6)-methyltransferase [Chryseobacterium balustinum]|uniref:tRNA1(Val) (adenine(37)-N6)-methyltransferase n=1 Tax=Chryseobacterium balustinum TaxID=246 RepID=A0AAX2IG83_9FLAO|nr:methyltransferase [Chryseobacterium balustinum]AZB31731.1 methyltransferase domain-containing protein [Chryseobacterium balustinum]SKB84000.1 tRNA1Val (adenine37-N6)-methyltransferase [Chryseobacterium balustinum]SQA86901.1 tRNA1(Val) (adenine(37)-N6)-methyltransferase [Chryseobacterium balustinum]